MIDNFVLYFCNLVLNNGIVKLNVCVILEICRIDWLNGWLIYGMI